MRHAVLDAKTPEQLAHTERKILFCTDVDALCLISTDAAVRIHQPSEQRPTLLFRRSKVFVRNALVMERFEKDGF
ncbi:hypothetical protein SDC9_131403 [bioreactor metagenome]|uniref:Uncharacterized protein n=1 Tax=bioreactor metagenome TaxID=1076179 RepID=A0A645D6S1_9ZZZZ